MPSLLGLLIWAMLVARAIAKHFWHDEIYTILASGLSPGALWRASRDGLDLAPPLNTILTGLVHAAVGAGPVATRLPPMVGFVSACLLVFVMVRRRSNLLVGMTGALVLCATAAFASAYEARGYGVVVGLFAAAVFGWSEAAAGRHPRRNLTLMACALAAGLWTHYYAALAFLPLAAGEIVRQFQRRRIEAAPWSAFAIAAAAAVPLLPLISAGSPQAATFWTRLEPGGVAATYRFLLGALHDGWYALAGAIIVALAIGELVRRTKRTNGRLRCAASRRMNRWPV